MNIAKYNVVWATPSQDASGSMPLGNGAIGTNLWIEPNGDLCFYLSRTDSWGEFGQLYKVGRVRVSLHLPDGQPLLKGASFRWELDLQNGAAIITTHDGWVRFWVDAHQPAVKILAEAEREIRGSVSIEMWRKERRELPKGTERHSLHTDAPYPIYHGQDHYIHSDHHQIGWYHYNRESSWKNSLRQQGLDALIEKEDDPLIHRCFGGLIQGVNLQKKSEDTLCTASPSKQFSATVTCLCAQSESPQAWVNNIQDKAHTISDPSEPESWAKHTAWWSDFWDRSWIDADGCEAARKVSRGYALQRYMNACSGRGNYPIKFNGSIFTVDWNYDSDYAAMGSERFDADYRRWGPGYWHQNTRLPYWSMLYAGDFEMMRPYFDMYLKALPVAKERVNKFCGHEGATFIETMWFWGAYLEGNYGWSEADTDGAPNPSRRDPELEGHLPQNQYIRRHNSSGLEVVYHGLLFYRYTADDDFLVNTLLPIAAAVLDYYDKHFERRNGKLHISPSQVIEQWWISENPLPEICGLQACLKQLLALPENHCPSGKRQEWERLLNELPDIPTGERDEKTIFTPAETWEGPAKNMENPELYAVFPYHHCNLDSDDLEVGRETFYKRTYTHDKGWAQDGMQAALLGLEREARSSVVNRLTTPSAYARFPAFWGPSFDWIPDQDQGGSAAHAFQLMVMQSIGNRIHLLPAWPEHWTVDFKLNAPSGVSVHGRKEAGQELVYELTGEDSEEFEVVEVSAPPSICNR
ncbi:MAG TPA: hypothetical protein DDW52_04410 [Planctomycetaceae bacterium]|nr:hypothetical protein [Planctomycetaceae bacterium]